jgi:hypothetical protein
MKAEYAFEPSAVAPGEQSCAVWWWQPDGDWPSLQDKLERLSPLEKRLRRHRTLERAITLRDLEAVRWFVEVKRSDVNAGRPLNEAAAMCGEAKNLKSVEVAIVRHLLDHGADPRLADEQGKTPLLMLLRSSPPPKVRDTVLEWLLDAGADPYAEMNVPPEERFRPGHHCVVWAASDANMTLLKRLERFPPEALTRAVANDHLQALRLMLDRGSDVNAKTQGGYTALHAAVGNDREEVVEELLRRGADVNARDNTGQTALHVAASWGNVSIARRLVAAGADPMATVTGTTDTPRAVAQRQLAQRADRTDAWGIDFVSRLRGVIDYLEALERRPRVSA